MIEQTLALIKPDAVRREIEGEIIAMICKTSLNIVAIKKVHLTKEVAAKFYAEHSEKPFFNDLVEFITSGPLYAIALEADDAIAKWRELMGSTNPDEAAVGTIRNCFGKQTDRNVVHGSDSPESAKRELPVFFSEMEFTR